MDKETLKTHLMQLGGIGRPTIKETVDGQDVEKEQWSESDTAKTIQTILDDNERLERELKETKDRYVNDFLTLPKPGESTTHTHETQNKPISPTDYLDF